MRVISKMQQQELVGGDFSWGDFLGGLACGTALAAGSMAGPVGLIAGVAACSAALATTAN